jgi:Holliday junction resolvase RusA-like endonuclease
MDVNTKNSHELLESVSDRIRCNVASCVEAYASIRWKKVSFTVPKAPEPSHRPRLCGYRVYVPGAAKNATFFNNNVLPTLKGLFITTPCKFKLDIYVETPKSFTKTQQILAEMKILRPWGNIGDIDNFEKAMYDMIQPNEKRGHVGIMSNDSLIIESHTNKYYSCSPRYELTISYMGKIPVSLIKTLRLKGDEEID